MGSLGMSLEIDGVSNVDPVWLRAEIAHRFGSIAALAQRFGAKENTVQAAITRPQPTGNHIIADALGYQVHQLWPQWYRPGGLRIRNSAPANARQSAGASSRQKGAAA